MDVTKRKSFNEWISEEKNIKNLSEIDSAKTAELIGGYADYVGGFIAGMANKDKETAASLANDFKAAFEPMKQAIDESQKAMKAQGLELQKMKDLISTNPSAKTDDSVIEETVKGIREVMKGGKQAHDIATKATVTRASVAGNANALDLPDVGQLASKRNSFYEFLVSRGRAFQVPPSANGTVRYIDWDEATKVRAAAMMAEGGTFPESTAAWQTYTVQLKKIGDMLPWTDEFEYDDAFLVSELQNFLMINVGLIKNNQLINGDGTGNNLAGIVNLSPAYTPVAAGIVDPSIYDLYVKLRETIEAQTGNKYRSDFSLMNIIDINKYKLKKDANNNYIMPPFYDAAGNRIDGVTVIEDNSVTANTMVIGDSRYTRMYAANGAVVETGYINDDFSTGKKRMRIYERCLFLIRTVDRTGFLKVTDIDAALVTLAL